MPLTSIVHHAPPANSAIQGQASASGDQETAVPELRDPNRPVHSLHPPARQPEEEQVVVLLLPIHIVVRVDSVIYAMSALHPAHVVSGNKNVGRSEAARLSVAVNRRDMWKVEAAGDRRMEMNHVEVIGQTGIESERRVSGHLSDGCSRQFVRGKGGRMVPSRARITGSWPSSRRPRASQTITRSVPPYRRTGSAPSK